MMLSTMLHCASRDAPILVWACTHNKGDQAMAAVEVANVLQLTQLVQPWKVSSTTHSNSLSTIFLPLHTFMVTCLLLGPVNGCRDFPWNE